MTMESSEQRSKQSNGAGSKPQRTGGRIEIGGALPPTPSQPGANPPGTEPADAAARAVPPTTAHAPRTPELYDPAPKAPAMQESNPDDPATPSRARAASASTRSAPSERAQGPEAAVESGPSTYRRSTRRPADQRENAFQGVAWLLEGITGVVEELRHSDLGLSEEFWVHAYAARRESLLAVRAVVDQLIEKAEADDRQEEERRQRRERRGGINIS